MPIGIRPINDFAFKKVFGSPANKLARIIHGLSSFRCKVPLRWTLRKTVQMQTALRNPMRKRGILCWSLAYASGCE